VVIVDIKLKKKEFTLTMKKSKSGGKLFGDKLRLIRLHWFGGKCMGENCNETENLELAHAIPTKLTREKPNGFRSSYERLQDVLNYPERFLLFCRICHFKYDGRDVEDWKEKFITMKVKK